MYIVARYLYKSRHAFIHTYILHTYYIHTYYKHILTLSTIFSCRAVTVCSGGYNNGMPHSQYDQKCKKNKIYFSHLHMYIIILHKCIHNITYIHTFTYTCAHICTCICINTTMHLYMLLTHT